MMLTGNTITKLQEMHLTVMANALKEQLSDANMNSLSFEDRIGCLLYTSPSPRDLSTSRMPSSA